MSPYDYHREKAWLFTDAGSRWFIHFRDRLMDATDTTGAITRRWALDIAEGISTPKGANPSYRAALDRLVEIGDFYWKSDSPEADQHDVLVRGT